MRISRVVIDLGIADLNEMLVDFLPDARLRVTDINESGIVGQVKLLLWNIDFAARPNSNRPDELSLDISASKLVPIPSMIVQRSLRDAIKDAPNGIDVIQQALKIHLPSILNPLGIYVKIRELKCYNGYVRVGVEGIRLPTPDFSKKDKRAQRESRSYSDRRSDANGRYENMETPDRYGNTGFYGNRADRADANGPDRNRTGSNESGSNPGSTSREEDSSSSNGASADGQGNGQGHREGGNPSELDSDDGRSSQGSSPTGSQTGSPESATRSPEPMTERRLSLPYPENESSSSFLPAPGKDTRSNASIVPPVPPPIVRVSTQGHDNRTQRRPIDYSFTTRRDNS